MYVKMVADPTAIYEADGPIMFGRIAIHVDETEPGVLEPNWDDLPFNHDRLHVGSFHNYEENRTKYEINKNLVMIFYAYWYSKDLDDGGIVSVANTGPIYILGNDGKTIDRV